MAWCKFQQSYAQCQSPRELRLGSTFFRVPSGTMTIKYKDFSVETIHDISFRIMSDP